METSLVPCYCREFVFFLDVFFLDVDIIEEAAEVKVT